MKAIRVLIVDDQSLIRDGLKMILDFEDGIEVVAVAKDGIEAYEMVKEYEPDIVLMDIRMPKMNGIVSTKKIKSSYPDMIIIALTTFNDTDYIIDIFNYGAEGYILKDIGSKKLVKTIYDAIEGEFFLSTNIAEKLVNGKKKIEKKFSFTNLEKEVASFLVKGNNNKEIAAILNISYGTVRNIVSAIYDKIGINDRIKAVFYLKDYF